MSTANPDPAPRRGELWRADLGDGKKQAVVVISLDARNLSERTTSVLVVPFGSYGAAGPTVLRMEPGESELPEPSYLKAHFIQLLAKSRPLEKLPHIFSAAQLRQVVLIIRRAVDPDAPYS